MRRIVLGATLLIAGTAGLGCRTTGFSAIPAQAVTGYTYTYGKATQGFAAPADEVRRAVIESANDLRVHSLKHIEQPGSTVFEGKTADNKPVTLTLNSQDVFSLVSARFGWLGDEGLSKAFMDRIGIRLGNLPPTAVPTEAPTATSTSSGSNKFLSREAVSDSVMLRDRTDAGYRDTVTP